MGFEPVTSGNTGAMLYQLSYEVTHWEPGYFYGFYLSHEGIDDSIKLFCTTETRSSLWLMWRIVSLLILEHY